MSVIILVHLVKNIQSPSHNMCVTNDSLFDINDYLMLNPKYLRKSKKGENGNLRYEIVEIHSEGEWIHVRAFPQIVLFLYEILGDNSPPFICAWPPIFP